MPLEYRTAEVIVVGTGIGGLAATKTYLELSPQTDIVLLEKVSHRNFFLFSPPSSRSN